MSVKSFGIPPGLWRREIVPAVILTLGALTISYGQGHQNLIKGAVFDVDTGLCLSAVNVYLSNTTLGDATDTLGAYQISNIPPGNYDLVYHFIGYEPLITSIDIGSRDTLIFRAGLKYTPYEMDSLVVTGERDNLWQRNLDRFIRHFIGRSNNARQAHIKNAEVLDFTLESFGVYRAEAQRELHIVNRALGYESYVHLAHFVWDYFEDTGQTLYYVRMHELEPESEEQRKEWNRKRAVTYNRSIRKFFRGLIDQVEALKGKERNYIRDTSFSVFGSVEYDGQRYKLFNGEIRKLQHESRFREIFPENDRYKVYGFKFDTYMGENPLMIIPDYGESSYLDYHDKQAGKYIFVLDQNGHLLNPLDVTIGGYWSKFRFGDFLPLNYGQKVN